MDEFINFAVRLPIICQCLFAMSTVASINLTANVTLEGSICPHSAIRFTCVALGVPFLAWKRNNQPIASFIPTSTIGPSNSVNIPRGFRVELVNVPVQNGSSTFNFHSIMIADLSAVLNRSDEIECAGFETSVALHVSYSTIRAAPPTASLFSYVFSSGLRDGEVTLTLTWDETFTTTNAVEMYCVRSDLCSDQCVEPDTPFSCPGLVAGVEYMFWVTAFNCDDQEGEESQPLVVHPQVPNPPVVLSILATYNSTTLLHKIDISWEASDQIFISNQYKVTNIYIITFEDNNGGMILRNHSVTNCVTGVCNATLMLNGLSSQGRNFTVSVIAKNLVGESNRSHSPSAIYDNSASYMEPSLTAKNCSVSAVCSSATLSQLTKCTVNFGTDPLYTQFTQFMSGVLNTVLQFSLIGSHSIYFYQATVNVSSTLTVNVQGELIAMPTAECTRQDGTLSIGVAVTITALIVFVVAFILGALFGVVLLHFVRCHGRHGDITTKSEPSKHEYYNVGARKSQLVKLPQEGKAPAINQDLTASVKYDTICVKDGKEKETTERIKFEENKAYGPSLREMTGGKQGISLQENVSYAPVNQ